MNGSEVRRLEHEVEEALRTLVEGRFPHLSVDSAAYHAMAKAAVAVLEAVQAQRIPRPRP